MNRKTAILCWVLFVVSSAWLGGCSSYVDLPPGTVKDITASPVVEQQPVEVPAPQTVAPPADYLIGPGDSLYINVNGRAELGSPLVQGSSKLQGSRVDGKGHIRLPLVGSVAVAGLSLEQVQNKLQKAYGAFLQNPWVVVEVAEFKSQSIQLLGQFKAPGTYYMDRPFSLLQGLAMGGGLLDTANLRSARLIRDQQTMPVDIFRLLREGSQDHDIWLQPGDTIYVPDDKNQNVYVFGAVKKTGPVPMPNGQLNLSQALASAGIDETGGNRRFVRVIRSLSTTRGQLLVVDLQQTLQGNVLPFSLMEGDIIYIPRSAVGNWNQAISELLPTLQAVSAVLQPFVQIKFLTDDD